MKVVEDWWRMLRRHPRLLDAGIALALFVTTTALSSVSAPHGRWLYGGIPLVAVSCGALLLRRRWPTPVLVVTLMSAEAYLALPQSKEVVLGAPLIALYTVAERSGWRWAFTVGVPALLLLGGLHLVWNPTPHLRQDNLTLIALGGLAVAAGEASRSRRAHAAEVEERARQAERDREQEARRLVTDERLRIARDLHDVVGHHLALINVQAGVAAYLLKDQPSKAEEALEHIMDASRTGLDELRETIDLLRDPADQAAPVAPTQDLAGLPELVETFRKSGLPVDYRVEGVNRPVPAATGLAAYRVIQEALTNVRKHAGKASARVVLGFNAVALRVLVLDDAGGLPPPASRRDGSGHGIAGMRERVGALGGSLEAEHLPDGGFRVNAMFPLPESKPT